jgi:hypothetical protein
VLKKAGAKVLKKDERRKFDEEKLQKPIIFSSISCLFGRKSLNLQS